MITKAFDRDWNYWIKYYQDRKKMWRVGFYITREEWIKQCDDNIKIIKKRIKEQNKWK